MKYLLLIPALLLVGCGDKSELELKLEHERQMALIEVQKIKAANPSQHTYVENEYEYEAPTYSSDDSNYATEYSDVSQVSQVPQQAVQQGQTTGSGYSGTDMLLAGGTALAAGYAISQLLDNGMKSYQDDRGVTHYTDKSGKPISKAKYDEAKKTSKVTQVKEKVKAAGSKAKDLGKKGIDKTKAKYEQVKASPKTQQLKEKAKYQARKAKVLTKKAAKKAKRKVNKVRSKRK